MNRFTWKAPDGTYQIDDCMAVRKTLCYDENFKNPFDIYEGKAIDKLGKYEDMLDVDYLHNILNEYFDIHNDTYAYNLTRVKTAFDIGTMSLDDFEEFNEETTMDLAEYIIKCLST